MRFIGGKALLLNQIKQVIQENTDGTEQVFCDIFAGTGAVARYFKPDYEIISNDFLHFSYVIQKATIENNQVPDFKKLKQIGILDPFAFLEESKTEEPEEEPERFFITRNYSPNEQCDRMYLSPQNARRIDYIRNTIEAWKTLGLIHENEYFYLLAGLVEGVPFVSNITGTYGAYLKKWDKRAHKNFNMIRLDVVDNGYQNQCFNRDANQLIREIEGDILYLDPPYNSRQYAPNYHLLETISRNDRPQISGVTGMRPYKGQKSAFCVKAEVSDAFEELVGRANFEHLVFSYSTEGLMSVQEIERILKKYGIGGTYRKYDIPYKKYQSKIPSGKDSLSEYIFYIRKNISRPQYYQLARQSFEQKADRV